jgi:hypothetical protein
VLAAGLIVVAIFAGRIAHDVSRQYDTFVHPGSPQNAASTSRLISGTGYRYDYWRIAWFDFKEHPWDGVGAGNYDVSYFKRRASQENVRQPHSLELQVLGETGIVGGLALLAFVGGVYLGAARRLKLARVNPVQRTMLVSGLGGFTAWLVHTSGDWMALLPGLTGMALCGAAVLTAYDGSPASTGTAKRLPALLTVAGVALALFGGFVLGRATIAARLEADGQAQLTASPRQALDDARQALSFNGASVTARYLQSNAYERLGAYALSRGALMAALRQEPSDWLTWALLGDLAVRHRDYRAAERYYRRAQSFNPRDPEIAAAVRNPRTALMQVAPPVP